MATVFLVIVVLTVILFVFPDRVLNPVGIVKTSNVTNSIINSSTTRH